MPSRTPISGRRTLAAGAAGVLALGLLATGPATAGAAGHDHDGHHAHHADEHHHKHHKHHGHHGMPAYKDARLPIARRVADLLSRMTLAEKIGQMTQAERIDVDANTSLITTHGLGSILSGGGSTPTDNTVKGWADMVDRYQKAALATRLHIPIIYGVDSVHGHGNMQGATVFPHNIGLGATRDPRLVEQIGHVTAIETRASGVPWTFAPCLCVARDDRWGRTYESFGESPQLVESMETAIDGLQGHSARDLTRPDHVLATAKHFAGDGLTTYDASKAGTGAYPIDQGVDHVTRAQFAQLALAPYKPAIKQHHVGSVMPSFSSLDYTDGLTDGKDGAVKMHANRELITGWLKGQQRFAGFVISDWRAIRQLPGDYRAQVKASVLAGVDMFMEPIQAPNNPTGWDEFIPTLTSLVQAHEVPMSRINDAVSRILTAKFKLGLFEHPYANRSLAGTVGDAAHHALARRAAAESQVLLKNDASTLPLKPSTHPVYVAGSNADSIGNQAGGWTLTWQGGSTNVVPGTTILDGIKADAGSSAVTYSADASTPVPAGADGVVVVGETPYAEGFGDVGGPQWGYDPADHGVLRQPQTMQLSTADTQAIKTVCAAAATCTVVVISGRPLIIPPDVLSVTDALVAGWLPGSEGIGVADDLFGLHRYAGKLPVTWPKSIDQEPINLGDATYDPLFPFGFGLKD